MPGERHHRPRANAHGDSNDTTRRRRAPRVTVALGMTGLLAVVLAACGATAAVSSAPPSALAAAPAATPAPTPTPLPGAALPAGYRAEGTWAIAFARPGDIHRETWTLTPACETGACDAVVEIRAKGASKDDPAVRGTLSLRDGRWVYEAKTVEVVDCTAGGKTVAHGALRTITTTMVLATWRVAGTTTEVRELRGSRSIVDAPVDGSACAPSAIVYPATGEPARR